MCLQVSLGNITSCKGEIMRGEVVGRGVGLVKGLNQGMENSGGRDE